MPTYYNRFTPYMLSSDSPSRSSNLIAPTSPIEWTSTVKPYTDMVWSPPSDSNQPTFDWTAIYLDGWVGAALAAPYAATTNFFPMKVTYKNLGDNYCWVFWLPLDANLASGLSTNARYQVLLPGQSTTVSARWCEDLYNDPAGTPGALGTHSPDFYGLGGCNVEVTVIPLNLTETMTAMGLTAA
jgi:hypothetical protein